MKELHFYMFDVITLFYISLFIWTNINISCTMVDSGSFAVFRVDHWVYSLATFELRQPQRGHVLLLWYRPTNG